MLFALLGTVNRDRIVTVDGSVHTSLGGILYNLLALARVAAPGDAILPVARAGLLDRAEIARLVAGIDAVDLSAMSFPEGASNEAILTYTGRDTREETVIDRVGPLSDAEVARAAGAPFLLANLISGWDFTPAQLAAARAAGSRILLDVQSLTLAPTGPGGVRAYREVPDWRSWCRPVEILKGNEEEIGWFLGVPPAAPADLERAARAILDAGPRVLAVTLGSRGAFVAFRDPASARPVSRRVPAVSGVRVVDTTGCGDAFAAGFLADYARSEDPLSAACSGNALAALVAGSRGLEALRSLPDPRPAALRLGRGLG